LLIRWPTAPRFDANRPVLSAAITSPSKKASSTSQRRRLKSYPSLDNFRLSPGEKSDIAAPGVGGPTRRAFRSLQTGTRRRRSAGKATARATASPALSRSAPLAGLAADMDEVIRLVAGTPCSCEGKPSKLSRSLSAMMRIGQPLIRLSHGLSAPLRVLRPNILAWAIVIDFLSRYAYFARVSTRLSRSRRVLRTVGSGPLPGAKAEWLGRVDCGGLTETQ
jgi:hypothetical protein